MNKEDREKYSDLYYWLMYDLPDLPDSKPKVWEAFSMYRTWESCMSIEYFKTK
jgi:hypothetical protein